ncbi:MAG: protein-L-isoaspartate(D-aspartate) O-methyltransferase [Planctomycetota bacterium]
MIARFIWVIPMAIFLSDSNAQDRNDYQRRRRDGYESQRNQLVEQKIVSAGVTDPRVLDSIRDTPRHEFVPPSQRGRAYFDMALPIGHSQTISSPFIVASMTEALEPNPEDKVLEIGTGSGYQAAVLSPLVDSVYSIEIVEPLGIQAAKVLRKLDYDNVFTRVGDGFLGWPSKAPFDKIIVTCSPESVPQPLIDQLAEGGSIIIPVGERYQQTLYRMTKRDGELVRQPLRPTLFVPMTGEAEEDRQQQPDPENPMVVNGDFELTAREHFVELAKAGRAADPPSADPHADFVPGWYYGRQVRHVKQRQPGSSSVRNHVRFENETTGLSSHLLQGIAISGKAVPSVRLSARCRTENVKRGSTGDQQPALAVTFYDEVRRELATYVVGPFRGTKPWRNYYRILTVPPQTTEAIVRIGLFGATGVAEFDEVRLERLD